MLFHSYFASRVSVEKSAMNLMLCPLTMRDWLSYSYLKSISGTYHFDCKMLWCNFVCVYFGCFFELFSPPPPSLSFWYLLSHHALQIEEILPNYVFWLSFFFIFLFLLLELLLFWNGSSWYCQLFPFCYFCVSNIESIGIVLLKIPVNAFMVTCVRFFLGARVIAQW